MERTVTSNDAITDIGMLWEQAVRDYNKNEKTPLQFDKAGGNMQAAMKKIEAAEKSFKNHRHNKSRGDKVRTTLGNSLGCIQKCIDGMQMIGSAASAFPPAMPVELIFSAAGSLISACAKVREQFDRIEEFFAFSARFFERLSILQQKAAGDQEKSHALITAIVRVFSQQLSVCAIVRKLQRQKRAVLWLKAVWSPDNPELAEAYGAMQASIEDLDKTVGFESLKHIRSVQVDVSVNSEKLDRLDEELHSFRRDLRQDVQQIYASNLKLEVVMKDGFLAMKAQHEESITLLHDMQKDIVKDVRKELSRYWGIPHDKEAKKQDANPKSNAGDSNIKALWAITDFFTQNNTVFPSWRDAHRENLALHQDLRGSRVKKTAEWLFEHPSFKNWSDGKDPILWLKGTEGVGKSFLAHSIVEYLRELRDAHSCVAYFYFKEEYPYLQSRQNAFASAALQIADAHTKYAKQVAADIKENTEHSKDISTWKRFFLSRFPGGEEATDRLYLIFDGLDEAYLQPVGALTQFLSDLKRKNANISVLATSRLEETPVIALLEPCIIKVEKKNIYLDIRELVKSRLQTLPRVRKFSPAIKKTIVRKVAEQADSMLYVEHMLRRFASIGRGQAVLEELEKMPRNLHDLYKLLLEECRRGRSEAQYQAMKKLFAWLAFSKRSLSLAEASSLVQLTLSDDTFDVEEEVVGRSSRILELSLPRQTHEDPVDGDEDDAGLDSLEDDAIPELQYRKSPLTFQDRSLRQFFKSASTVADREKDFRTPATAAHLTIFQMCTEIMVKATEGSENRQSSVLALYAIQNWYEHLEELDVDKMTDDATRQVVLSLYSITQNMNNLATLFERLARHTDIYPERDGGIPVPWFDILLPWLAKAKPRVAESLQVGVRDWLCKVKDTNILLPLARGHVENWMNATDQVWILEKFRFAKAALLLMEAFEPNDAEPFLDIKVIEEKRDVPVACYKAFRAFGTTLSDFAYRNSDEVCQKKWMATSIVYLEQSITLMKEDDLEKVAALRILAAMYAWNDQIVDAIKSYDQAYAMLPPSSKGNSLESDSEIDEVRLGISIAKAKVYFKEKDIENALRMFNQARIVSAGKPLEGTILDDITLLFTGDDDKDGYKLMEVLAGWTESERNSWFCYCFEGGLDESALNRMARAAKQAKKTDELLSWLSALADKIQANGYYLFNVKNAIAFLYYPVLGDIEQGRSARFEVLDMELKHDSWYKANMQAAQSTCRNELADMSFHEFRISTDPAKKAQLIEDLKVTRNAEKEKSEKYEKDNTSGTHVTMLRTNMLRIMGPATKYQEHMNELFNECMSGLEDDVAWNDSRNLRLLSKVLASLDGLEVDAMIAASAQFSVLDRSLHGEDAEFESAESESDLEDVGSIADGEPADENQITAESTEPEEFTMTISVLDKTPAPTSRFLVPETRTLMDAMPARLQDTQTFNSATKANGTNGEVTKTISVDPECAPVAPITEADEDINGVKIGCDGGCGTVIDSWSQPFFFCLVCPNCDLCQPCHRKRLEQTAKNVQESWPSFCGPHHCYIKAPIKGWMGIKDGVIRRDGKENREVKVWLETLKKERWQKAWDTFWTRQGGLKDVGVGY